MTKLIAFDTSGPYCAAALLLDGSVKTRVDDMARGQAEHLMPMLDALMAEHGMGWQDLDGIGVGVGPGNFTGIRIAVAAARGLALGLDKPAIGVSTFAAQAEGRERPLTVVLPAPRGQCYVQEFSVDGPQTPYMASEQEALPDGVALAPPIEMIKGMARVAAMRLGSVNARPAPLYMRPADAAPPRDAAPVILP